MLVEENLAVASPEANVWLWIPFAWPGQEAFLMPFVYSWDRSTAVPIFFFSFPFFSSFTITNRNGVGICPHSVLMWAAIEVAASGSRGWRPPHACSPCLLKWSAAEVDVDKKNPLQHTENWLCGRPVVLRKSNMMRKLLGDSRRADGLKSGPLEL